MQIRKVLLGSLILLFCSLHLDAQIMNASFEDLNSNGSIQYWGNTFLQAVWLDSNGISHSDSIVIDQSFCQSSNDAHTGSKSIEMRNAFNYTQNKGISGATWYSSDTIQSPYASFVPIQPLPTHFSFYYKYFPTGNDTASVQIEVYDGNMNLIGSGLVHLQGTTSNYTYINVPINYTSTDTAGLVLIHFQSSSRDSNAQFGTRFLIDDVSVATPNQLPEVQKHDEILCYPNPSSHYFRIHALCKIKAVDILDHIGNLICTHVSNVESIDVSRLINGNYVVRIKTESDIIYKKLLVQH